MRSPAKSSLSLALLTFLACHGWAQETTTTNPSEPAPATKQEEQQLRSEVASQRQTIDELKSTVQELIKRLGTAEPRLINAVELQTGSTSVPGSDEDRKSVVKGKSADR